MADTNQTINLEGTEWISGIPGIYFVIWGRVIWGRGLNFAFCNLIGSDGYLRGVAQSYLIMLIGKEIANFS